MFLYSFISNILLLVVLIPFLKRVKYGQSIRELGPQSHFVKQGTPTMGGIAIGITIILVFSIYSYLNEVKYYLLYIIPIIIYLLIGFIDDYLIVVRKKNDGISPKMKLILQIIGASIYYYFYLSFDLSTEINVFNKPLDIKWGYGVLILIMFVATTNAVNLSDGIDGLATGLLIISFITIALLSYILKISDVYSFTIIVIGTLMAFLCFNANPAKIFMGNTGSMLLGSVLANLMILLKLELLLIVLAFVFVIEAVSVIAQVIYFKKTKGKRLFLMSPLHHHFELKGYSEWQVDILFWLLASIASIITIMLVL